VAPNDELKHLAAELERLQDDHANASRILRLTDTCLRGCSTWKWEQHGWTISDGQACGIRNGDERARRTALLAVLKEQVHEIEFVAGLERLEIVLGPSRAEPV